MPAPDASDFVIGRLHRLDSGDFVMVNEILLNFVGNFDSIFQKIMLEKNRVCT